MGRPRVVSPPWHRLSWRVFTGTMVLVLLLLAIVLGVATTGARRTARSAARQSLEQTSDLVAQLLAGRGRSLGGGARVFVQGPYFRTLVAERRRDDILDQTFEAAEQLEASWVFITDDAGSLVAKSDEPSAFGEPMAQVPLVSAALRGQVTTGFGGSGDSVLFQATAVPIAAPGGMPFGVLVATRVLDSRTASDIALATNRALMFFVLDEEGRARVAATSLAGDTALRNAVVRAVSSALPTGASAHGEVTHEGRTWMLHRSTLATAGGTPVGGYVVLQAADDALAGMVPVRESLMLAAVIGLLGALVAARLTARAVAHPVSAMALQVRQVVEQGGGAAVAAERDSSRALYGSAEVTALSDAVDALVIEANDQDTVRALVAALPAMGSDAEPKPKSSGRTLTFRTSAVREGGWAPGMLIAQRYRLDEELDRTEAGAIFRARDIARGEVVVLRPLRADGADQAAPDVAVATAGSGAYSALTDVVHRHLVRILDVGDADGIRFVSLEYVDGLPLAALLARQGTLAAADVAAIARQLLRGMAALHAAHVIHGHITSRRVLLSRTGVVKLDTATAGRSLRRPGRSAGADDTKREIGGALGGARVGAPEYMAPELLIGGAPRAVSDIYAAGVVLHECLTGDTPFASQSPVALLGSKLAGATASPVDGDVSGSGAPHEAHVDRTRPLARSLPGASPRHGELLTLVQQMMHPDAGRRFESAVDALEAWRGVGRLSAVIR